MSVERKRRVLIVDDEPANVRVLAEVLGGAYELSFATSGAKALELAASSAPDLILLDVVMPGLDGYEVLRRLKMESATAGIPVIFVTAMSELDDEARGLELGAVDYITKPVSAPIVRARVRTHLELKAQRDLLERRAFLDGLTGIANRRRFDEELERRWRVAASRQQPLTLLLLDVDHYKQFNDNYGHGAGDECLRRVAAALDDCFDEAEGLAARYGGEEFVAIAAEGTGTEHARRVLEAVRALAIPHAHSSAGPHVSVSIGAVELVPQADASPRAAIEIADRLLYEAKQGGRNRVRFEKAAG
jgi:diguanylate cyclase (GGDEF)-like protein